MKWHKTSPWGNYLDPTQNYKENGLKHRSLITEARRICYLGKHVGSKKLSTILGHIKGVHYSKRKESNAVPNERQGSDNNVSQPLG